MKTIIYNAHILTMDEDETIYKQGYLVISDALIESLGDMGEMSTEIRIAIEKYEHGDVVDDILCCDAKGGLLIPGMINCHTHIGMIPFRSLGDDVADRLRRFLFPLEADLKVDFVRASARYAMAEMLLSGITTFADMYYYEDALVQDVKAFGMRAILGETIIHMKTCDSDREYGGFEIMPDLIKACDTDLVQPMIAPHATNTNSEEALLRIKELAKKNDIPIMMHISEMDYEMEYFRTKYQQTPVEYLECIGLLDKKLLAVHCIHINDRDIELLKERDVAVIHCIGANLKAGKGIMPLKKVLEKGIRLGIGTDGPSSGNTLELFSLLRTMAYTHKTANKDRTFLKAKELLKLATVSGAEALQLEKVGRLKVGYQADICLIETESVNMFPIFDPYSAIVYSANASNVDCVWVGGKLKVYRKKLVDFDLSKLRKDLYAQMSDFIRKAKEQEEAVCI